MQKTRAATHPVTPLRPDTQDGWSSLKKTVPDPVIGGRERTGAREKVIFRYACSCCSPTANVQSHSSLGCLNSFQTNQHATHFGRSPASSASSTTAMDTPHGLDSQFWSPSENAGGADNLFDANFGEYLLNDVAFFLPFDDPVFDGPVFDSEMSLLGSPGATIEPFSSSLQKADSSSPFEQDLYHVLPRNRLQLESPVKSPCSSDLETLACNTLETKSIERLDSAHLPGDPTASPPIAAKLDSDVAPTATSKRLRAKSDARSACWTSPLSPNHGSGDAPPNPSTCGGGCAPFLFSEPAGRASTAGCASEDAPRSSIEIHDCNKGRSESLSSSPRGGRQSSIVPPSQNDAVQPPRKRSESSDASSDAVQASSEDAAVANPKNRRRVPHNQVERRYRESLNTQLDALRSVMPSLQQPDLPQDPPGRSRQDARLADMEDLPSRPSPAAKPSKAVILASATAHIRHMEKERERVEGENRALVEQVKQLQAMVKCDECGLLQFVKGIRVGPVS